MRLLGATVLACALVGCSSAEEPSETTLDPARQAFGEGRFSEALEACDDIHDECEQRYCQLVARTLLWVDDFNHVLLPTFRSTDTSLIENGGTGYDLAELTRISADMSTLSGLVPGIVAAECEFDIPAVPFQFGDEGDWVVDAEIRGRWTPASAAFVGAAVDSIRYIFAASIGGAKVPEPPLGETIPGLPDLLESVSARLGEQESWLRANPVAPGERRGGWHDANQDGAIDPGDELLVDLFAPGTSARVFDFSDAPPIDRESLPLGVLTPTSALPSARCGYEKWHIETLFDEDVGTTDGLSFSSDGKRIAFPKRVDGDYQLFTADVDGKNATCISCDVKNAWNDGVRFRPEHPDTLLFISTRDHPHAVGGAGGGFGQELYVMRADGSGAIRLTESGAWATNYHANWSHDGKQLVWGTTANRTWDVMVADFVDDASGMRLENVRRVVHDTSWWETHDFTLDGRSVITTNTRAGWQSADLYAIELDSGNLTRLTDDPAWDEHAHLSPDGRKLSWISGRWRPASVWRMTDGSHSALYDFFWIGPAIFFNFLNPPAGFSTELTLMNADGTDVTRLTDDDEVCADNVWSPDSTKLLFRQTPVGKKQPAKIRMLHFDDCSP